MNNSEPIHAEMETKRQRRRQRETTQLLCEHMSESLALLVESYIISEKDGYPFVGVFETLKAGHWELSKRYFNEYYSSHRGLEGAIAGNSIELVRKMIDHNSERLNYYILLAKEHHCDQDIIDLLIQCDTLR